MAISTVGFLSILGLKLEYENKSYSNSYNVFFFTNGVKDGSVLGGIDCCNFTDWVARSVGIDIYQFQQIQIL